MKINGVTVLEVPANRATAGYARKSLDKADTEFGVQSQAEEHDEAVEGWGIPAITHRYVDNSISAHREDAHRPEYQRLRADIEAMLIATVVIWHANRLHRRVEEALSFMNMCIAYRVKVYSVQRGTFYDFTKAQGRKDFIADTNNAEADSSQRGDNVRVARKRQAKQGAWGGGVRAYGWGVDTGLVHAVCVNPKAPPAQREYEHRPVIDMTKHNEQEAAEIRRWRDAVLAGVPNGSIIADLNRRGVLTQGQTDGRVIKRNGKIMESSGWQWRTVERILLSPRTAGHGEHNEQIIARDVLPPIITSEEQDRLRAILCDPAHKVTPAARAGNQPKWLGSLIITCGVCRDGTPMVSGMRNGQRLYRCDAKGHATTPADEADKWIEKVAQARLSRPDLADLIPSHDPTVSITELQVNIAKLEEGKAALAASHVRYLTTGAGLTLEMLEQATAQTDQLIADERDKLARATTSSPLTSFLGRTQDEVRAQWESLTLPIQREIVRLVMRVEAIGIGRGRRSSWPPIEERVIITPITAAA